MFPWIGSLKGMFWRNKRKIDFSSVSSDSRFSEKIALKCPPWPESSFSCEVFDTREKGALRLQTAPPPADVKDSTAQPGESFWKLETLRNESTFKLGTKNHSSFLSVALRNRYNYRMTVDLEMQLNVSGTATLSSPMGQTTHAVSVFLFIHASTIIPVKWNVTMRAIFLIFS